MKEHIKTAWTHIRRSPYQALSAIAIMVLTFFLAALTVLLAAGSQTILRYFETRPQVTAFFEDQFSLAQVEDLKNQLAATGKVKETKYVSKQEALAIYREQNKDDPLLLEMVTANILPASLEIATTDLSYLPEIALLLENEPGVEEVIFQEDVVKTLKNWTKTLRLGGLLLVSFLSLVSFLIVLIIIGMKVALRKEEVQILHLLGANAWFVRAPFVLEGVFYGVVGAFFAWGLVCLLLLYATPFLVDFFAGLPILPIPLGFLFLLLAGQVLAGVLIGSLGSLLAVKRYWR